jgi:hypothetical protein
MKREEITSDEADDLIKAAIRNRKFGVLLEQKRQKAHLLQTPGPGPRLNKRAGGNSLKNK